MLTHLFEEECSRLAVVRGAMMRTLTQQHARGLEKQAAAMRTLQRDLHSLQADMDGVHQGLADQLGAIERVGDARDAQQHRSAARPPAEANSVSVRRQPHWRVVPLQRRAPGDELEAAESLQRAWRRRRPHVLGRGWRYMPPAERWALMHSVPLEEQQIRMGAG